MNEHIIRLLNWEEVSHLLSAIPVDSNPVSRIKFILVTPDSCTDTSLTRTYRVNY